MSLYKQTPDGPWWVTIQHQGARVRRSTEKYDRAEAQRVHDEIKAELWKVTPKIKGRTWGDAVLRWCEKQQRSESELLSLSKFARVYPDRAITDVTRDSVHEALGFCKTAGTYTRYRTMIQAILNVAKDEGWLREVPKLATRTDKKAKPRLWITHEQWEKLYGCLPRHLQGPALFAVSTGLRQANVFGLTWDRVDLDRRLVWVEGFDTKSGNAVSVPLSDEAIAALKAVAGEHSEYVFTYRRRPIKKVKRGFKEACLRAGFKEFTWHGLRHTWATWHVQAGTPLGVLQHLGGWSDLRMVMNYAHHSPDYVAQYANNTKAKK